MYTKYSKDPPQVMFVAQCHLTLLSYTSSNTPPSHAGHVKFYWLRDQILQAKLNMRHSDVVLCPHPIYF